MLAGLTELKGYRVEGADGEIGRIADLCFREDEWIVRYVVVHSPVIASEEPITAELPQNLQEYYDQYSR